MQVKGMTSDYSWETSARAYQQLYEWAIAPRAGGVNTQPAPAPAGFRRIPRSRWGLVRRCHALFWILSGAGAGFFSNNTASPRTTASVTV